MLNIAKHKILMQNLPGQALFGTLNQNFTTENPLKRDAISQKLYVFVPT